MRNPRISVSLRPSEKQLIDKLAYYRGVSASRILSELVEASFDPLQRLANILELATKAKAGYERDFRRVVSDSASQIEDLFEIAKSNLREVEEDLEKSTH